MLKKDFYYLPFVKTIPDNIFLKIHYLVSTGKKLNLKCPFTFNEKIQWLKLYDHNPLYTIMVDKYEAKKYVSKLIGETYVVPTLGIYNTFDEINFDKLPDEFVLKCTHDSGSVVICKNRHDFDVKNAKKVITSGLRRNYYYIGREWAYKDVKPRIISEKYLVDESNVELKDYKIFCFNGEPKIVQVDYNRFSGHKRNLYSCNWEYINGTSMYPTNPEVQIRKPMVLENLLEIARNLSKGIPHVRIDFYIVNTRIYFGEFTLYHGSGFEKYKPESLNVQLGSYLQLPKKGNIREGV